MKLKKIAALLALLLTSSTLSPAVSHAANDSVILWDITQGNYEDEEKVEKEEVKTEVTEEVEEVELVEGAPRLEDDFYNSVNYKWIEETKLPADSPSVNPLSEMQDNINEQLRKDMNTYMAKPESAPAELKEFLKFYDMVLDKDTRTAEGYTEINGELKKIDAIDSIDYLNKNFVELTYNGIQTPFMFAVTGDMANSEKNMLYVVPAGLSLGQREMYEGDMAEIYIPPYKNYVEKLFTVIGYAEADAKKIAEDAIAFDKLMLPYMATAEESSSFLSLYNPTPLSDFDKSLSEYDITAIVKELTGVSPEVLSVSNAKYFEAITKLFNKDNLPMIKNWMKANALTSNVAFLSPELQAISFEYSSALTGATEQSPEEERDYNLASSLFDPVIGQYYGKKYFGTEAKADVQNMVKEIIDVYEKRIQANEWLSKSTKDKAILKLDNLQVNIGYPEKVAPFLLKYKVITTEDKGTLLSNAKEYNKLMIADNYSKLSKPVDRTEWAISPSTVNAIAQAMTNTLTFPAGILSEPMYDVNRSKSENYGAIGVVIAHEISHVFDTNGSLFDEKGNLSNWWTEEDYAAFQEHANKMIAQFDGLPFADGKVNGTLTVSENIADLGGVAAALEAVKDLKDGNLDAFFKTWADVWKEKSNLEFQRMYLNDTHSPNIYRVNTILSNFDEFFETYSIVEGDEMFRPKAERINIW